MDNQPRKLSRGRTVAIALAAACAFGAASLAAAGDAPSAPAPSAKPVVVNQVRIQEDGLRVYVDPATGRIKQPTPGEVRALDQALASMPALEHRSLQATQYADGAVSISLDGDFLNYALVRVNADGSLSQACVDDAAAASQFMAGGAPAAEDR